MNTATFRTNQIWAYLQIMRPANIVTAWADILAGFAASGCVVLANQDTASLVSLGWLLLSTTGLYGGGVVFNDVFDAELDAIERPERPIPSGRASREGAIILGIVLLSLGIVAAYQVSWMSAIMASGIAFCAVFYDAIAKHHSIFGPLNMGICRGGNLLLGISIMPEMVGQYWFLALIPIVYIAAITLLSRGEVSGGKSSTAVLAVVLIFTVISGLCGLGFLNNYQILTALPFIIVLAVRVLQPFIQAVRSPSPEYIRIAVKAGILSLIVLDATISAGFAGLTYGVLVFTLLPISMLLAQMFAVT
jgi:4-hydroxybenzoate polyprenyltransferase